MASKNPKSGEDFTELSVKLLNDTFAVCEETFAAIDDVPPPAQLQALIKRAEAHVAYYNELLEEYTGGRQDSIRGAAPHIGQLVKFTDTLKTLAKKKS
jgi:hypothetical protein